MKQNTKYIGIGIYEYGDVILCENPNEAFIECTYTIAFIKSIKGECIGRLQYVGNKVYSERQVECDMYSITSIEAWKIILENDFFDKNDGIINWLVYNKKNASEELLDFIRENRPDEDISGLLVYASNLDTAIWLYEHGASLEPEGYKYGVKGWWEIHKDAEHKRMYDYFFKENKIGA